MRTELTVVYKDEGAADTLRRLIDQINQAQGEDGRQIELVALSEKAWDLKKKTPPVSSKTVFVGGLKDSEALICFIDTKYERWGVKYGYNSRYAVIAADTVFIKDKARYDAFLQDYNDAMDSSSASMFEDPSTISDSIPADPVPAPPSKSGTSKVAKTFGTVGLAVATGGASLAAQKIYDDSKNLAEKQKQLLQFGIWHFVNNCLDEFLEG